MEATLDALIRGWDGLGVVSRYDAPTGTWIFIALHDDTLGSPTGGTRIKIYPAPQDGLLDAIRLAEGMTHKWAAIDLDSGGGKAVLALSRDLEGSDREGLMLRYGRLVESLRGTFSTGRDLGSTDEDMLVLSRVTQHVHGVDRDSGTAEDPGPYTAAGVYAAMEATLIQLFDTPDFAGKRIVIQGAGAVGRPLARRLAAAGAALSIGDVDANSATALCAELGVTAVPAEGIHRHECDLLAPCAVGQTLNAETIPSMQCRAVVGSANNQLGVVEDAQRLHERGILYAPDFIANGGGALAFGLKHRGEVDEETIAQRLLGIRDTIGAVLQESAGRDESPLVAAQRLVSRTLAAGRRAPTDGI